MFIDFSINEIKQKAISSTLRFPWVVLVITLCTAISCLLVLDSNFFGKSDDILKILFCLYLGIPISIGLTILKEYYFESKNKIQIEVLLILIGSLTLIYFILPKFGSRSYVFKYAQLILIAHLFVSLAPFFKITENENLNFWSYNDFLLFRIIKSAIYAMTFWIGFALAITTVNLLFKTRFYNAYEYLGIILTVQFQTWFFISGIPENIKSMNENFKYRNELRIFTQFALVPITLVYLLILYAYGFKILIQWNLPSGYIGWLVSTISVLGALTLLLIHPLRKSPDHRWVDLFWKYYFVLILPLLALLFWALSVRIYNYGITESRFVLTICGITLTLLSLYFIFNKKENIKWIPFSLMFFSVITLIGPLDATRISFNSQLDRFKNLIAKNNVTNLENLKKIQADDATSITSILYYLQSNNKDKIHTYIKNNFTWVKSDAIKTVDDKGEITTGDLIYELNKINQYDSANVNLYSILKNQSTEPFSFSKAKMFFPLDLNTYTTKKTTLKINGTDWSIFLVKDKIALSGTKTNEIFEIPLSPIFNREISKKHAGTNNNSEVLDADLSNLSFDFKDIKGTLVINTIKIQINENDRTIQELNGILLLN